jgi:hypothetical protein
VAETAPWWADVRVGDHWGPQVAHILHHAAPLAALAGTAGRRRVGGLRGAMTHSQAAAGALAPALVHGRQVPRSSWSGRFPCSPLPEVPRTPNALEQFFGAQREHARRTTGRQGASPGGGFSGSGRLGAAAATRLRPFSAEALAPENVSAWQARRQARKTRRQQRARRQRFRQAPISSLAKRAADFLLRILPP